MMNPHEEERLREKGRISETEATTEGSGRMRKVAVGAADRWQRGG